MILQSALLALLILMFGSALSEAFGPKGDRL
jgi:hypothetical protein